MRAKTQQTELDPEAQALRADPAFRAEIERARASARAEGTISEAELARRRPLTPEEEAAADAYLDDLERRRDAGPEGASRSAAGQRADGPASARSAGSTRSGSPREPVRGPGPAPSAPRAGLGARPKPGALGRLFV
jgi:hypothetical protein